MSSKKLSLGNIGEFFVWGTMIGLLVLSVWVWHPREQHASAAPPSTAPTMLVRNFKASIDVARVFGRSPGCAEAEPNFIALVADEAISANLDPRILAATIAVESACASFAVSTHGSVGLMQVTPKTWRATYDFEHQYNLLNTQDNLRVGTLILANLIKQWGLTEGLRHYNGVKVASDAYDPDYATKIKQLAGK